MGPVNFRQSCLPARRLRAACSLALALASLALAPAASHAQDSETAETTAVILEPGSLVNTADMDFGQIAPAMTAGTVVLSASASATCGTTGGIVHSGTCQAAEFAIYGRQNWRVRMRQTGGAVVLTEPGGATMTVTNLTIGSTGLSPRQGANGWNLGNWDIIAPDGIATIYLGGTLNVGANQVPGVYNGTVLVEALFN